MHTAMSSSRSSSFARRASVSSSDSDPAAPEIRAQAASRGEGSLALSGVADDGATGGDDVASTGDSPSSSDTADDGSGAPAGLVPAQPTTPMARQPNVAANIARRGIRRVGAWATSACLNSPAPVDGFIAALLASRSRERLIATLSPEMALRTGCARASQTKPATPSATVYTGAIVATWIR